MFRAPPDIYGSNLLDIFINELGNNNPVAQYLGVSVRTVERWRSGRIAPRAAVLALYWESNYGRSQMNTEFINEIRLLFSHVRALEQQYAKATRAIAEMRKVNAGTANDVIYEEFLNVLQYPTPTCLQPASTAEASVQRAGRREPHAPAPKTLPNRSRLQALQQFREKGTKPPEKIMAA